jgi:hypothetical protein
VNQDVVGVARIFQIGIVPRQILDTRFRRLDEDLRFVAGAAQHALDTQHFVTDGVAVAKGREHLMNGGPHAFICAICGRYRAPPPPPGLRPRRCDRPRR